MDEAASWYARLNASDCSDADRRDFMMWRNTDPRNDRAWQSIASASDGLEDLANNSVIAQMIREAHSMPPVSSLEQQFDSHDERGSNEEEEESLAPPKPLLRYAMAAAFVLTMGLGAATVWKSMEQQAPEQVRLAENAHYATAVGESRSITLADGSKVTLDTNSAIEVPHWGKQRVVYLTKGQAYFEVAKDKLHPFVVKSEGKSVEALGTAFTVRAGLDNYDVALLEGRVKVNLGMAGARDTILNAGDTLSLSGKTIAIRHKYADKAADWIDGRLTFDAMPLGQIVEEMNRYSARKIVLQGTALQTKPFSGTFRSNGSDELVQALSAYGIAHVAMSDDQKLVLKAN
ncbi:DUF4880 domain-containing protein [Altererythrobacter indicus]|uniref:DUF4880 domain-containing protein n=1 Tax=Altericroceibacterium indicum TaxID=374177 RepID=A0A845AAG8_9SPHN|nr:FecR domain-containing protein [Altericroceibacterium indicum]MXP26684.1 DUF4880 domain-containing protein [Altericroceibacterium indicum]